MDGRWKLALAGGVLAGLVGCTTTTPPNPFPAPAPAPAQTGKNAVFVPEPPDEGPKKTGPLAPVPCSCSPEQWVESVAKDPNKPAADRERLLGQARQAYTDVLAEDPQEPGRPDGPGRDVPGDGGAGPAPEVMAG